MWGRGKSAVRPQAQRSAAGAMASHGLEGGIWRMDEAMLLLGGLRALRPVRSTAHSPAMPARHRRGTCGRTSPAGLARPYARSKAGLDGNSTLEYAGYFRKFAASKNNRRLSILNLIRCHLAIGANPLVRRGIEFVVHVNRAAYGIATIATPSHAQISISAKKCIVIGLLLALLFQRKLHHAVGESVGALSKAEIDALRPVIRGLTSISLVCRAGRQKCDEDQELRASQNAHFVFLR